ncbi:SDR family oxidoreductase [Umezakia ovalisporum]|uniref:SDR family oxidoreductase n=1 Tax=Umezakia ovalisporum TaxID=75695 RepID=UPI0006EF9733|nr:SDR family oxidoreductase [Umezakia ovalisporum]MBI1241989.1 NAD-dependent epimerase/dehydratase family protein [Nostoc sp. RI_552]MDH6068172.1 SDR family oxidoreductase [Umezakia ovalisporum APH033B]MDH6085071.1 SDR family oxidoreductase [Umezakia ovalisporum TAC611]MDH6088424.1 SDR family oxidoreductase [Umezakia ovalisporum Ak1311]CEJ45862.1 Nucleoside-diphosphate-sugar epimerase (Uncharact erized protein) [Umezakia ovalisporum]
MNISIIGCGYVGYAVAQYWQQRMTFMVTATTTTPERVPILQSVAQKVVVSSGSDSQRLKYLLQNQDVVLLTVGAKKANSYQETYFNTAKTLVELLPELPSIKQLIYTGSYSVYGDHNGAWVDEETLPTPSHENGKILKTTEDVLLGASSDHLRVCILRLGGIYGPNRELMKIFSQVPGTTRLGDGEDVANWIHLDDIVGAIEFVRQHHLQGIYNLVDDSYLTSRDLLDTLLQKHNLPRVKWDNTFKSSRLYNAKVANQKIKKAGYKLIHPQMIF